jgi:hypothetical protein
MTAGARRMLALTKQRLDGLLLPTRGSQTFSRTRDIQCVETVDEGSTGHAKEFSGAALMSRRLRERVEDPLTFITRLMRGERRRGRRLNSARELFWKVLQRDRGGLIRDGAREHCQAMHRR